MYRGKHEMPRKGLAKYKKSHIMLVSLLLVMTIGVGATVAFLMDSTDALVNVFNPSHVTSSVLEDEFNRIEKTNVKIQNTGDIDAYIRAAIVVTWKDADENVYPQMPEAGVDYVISFKLTDEEGKSIWVEGNDGYYYYCKPVAAGGTTAVLINSCKPVDGKTPAGYGLNVEILGSAIQAEGMGASSAQDAFAIAAGGTT